jgi:hypothetical protein
MLIDWLLATGGVHPAYLIASVDGLGASTPK